MTASIDDVLDFWLVETTAKQRFIKDPEFDQTVRERLGSAHELAVDGSLADWRDSARGCLALCILLDQAPRNMFRDTPRAFATDELARAVAGHAIDQDFDRDPAFDDDVRLFFYMPFMHSEDEADQDTCVRLISERIAPENRGGYAERHRVIVMRFGRFPHRNAILGRENTPEEETFLSEDGSGF